MKLKPTLFSCLLLLVFIVSCKKPAKGYYEVIFTGLSNSSSSFNCVIHSSKTSITIEKPGMNGNPHIGITGNLSRIGNKIKGTIKHSNGGLGSSYTHTYTIDGEVTRKKMSGNYTCTTSSWNGFSGSSTSEDSGTFSIRFITKHEPDH